MKTKHVILGIVGVSTLLILFLAVPIFNSCDSGKTSESTIASEAESSANREEFKRTVENEIPRDFVETAEHSLKERDPREFVKMKWKTGLPYTKTRLLYKPDSLPTLYALLEDPEYERYWPQLARMICFIGDDDRSVQVVLKYFRRADDWSSLDTWHLGNRCGGKIESLQWIGLIGGDEADKTLRQALTRDGARELIKEWIDGPLPDWASASWENEPQGQLIERIQGYAAMGIVYSQNQQSIRLVDELYKTVNTERILNNRRYTLYTMLREATANRNLIEVIGIKEYCNLLGGDGDKYYRAIIPYREMEAYRIRDQKYD